jgi:hypothetical protein
VLEIDALGRLENKIVKVDTDYSLVALNKVPEEVKA